VGLDEGDEVSVEVKDGIVLKPVRRFDRKQVEDALKRHLEKLKATPSILQPRPGELSKTYLEEEFED
ncbi:MAG: AbrB/MazE/SpoVT family DNA-binding domain-containing protein, partial [Candidatus Bathyarchaeia archaeon]